MQEHKFIFLLFIIPAIGIALISYYIYMSTMLKSNEEKPLENATRKRGYFLIVFSLILFILLGITIPKSPYFLFADKQPEKIVYVSAFQFSYLMGYKPIDPITMEGSEPIELPAGKPVEFRVTSIDVNHGFAIYNDKAELIIQTQAMPKYVNRLRWQFDIPGTYTILCLEFCGFGHHNMRSTFTVK